MIRPDLRMPSSGSVRRIYTSLALLVLMIPAIAMQFTSEVAWDLRDFAAMAALLAMLGIGLEVVSRLARTPSAWLIGMAGAIVMTILLWVELATGKIV